MKLATKLDGIGSGIKCKKLPEKLRRYAPAKEKKEKKDESNSKSNSKRKSNSNRVIRIIRVIGRAA